MRGCRQHIKFEISCKWCYMNYLGLYRMTVAERLAYGVTDEKWEEIKQNMRKEEL